MEAGAEVDETTHIVRFQKHIVEEALGLAPKSFSLGARRSGRDLHMNRGDFTIVISNCEVLATLCLVQAAEPGVPFI